MRAIVMVMMLRRYAGAFVARGAVTSLRRPAQRQAVVMMSDDAVPFSRMDIRVGTFRRAWAHPDSEKLFIEEIDVGEEEPRQIVSGLQAYYSAEDLEGMRCLVVANLPKAKLAGVDSFGMVLCGSENDKAKVEILLPPDDAEIGDRVLCGDDDDAAATPNQVKKKKIWTKVQPRLALVDGIATCDGLPMATPAGPCRSPTIQAGPIS
mmetsp:Transcript_4640/g.11936  ORF Transcript_4640/g.11936 Transcript_4640/m.11936 type:complete len:207 (+) Transcript_4640:12-632(+)